MERGVEEIYELGKLELKDFEALAQELGEALEGGETVLLFGDLGSGKTTFVKALASGLGIDQNDVRSPTFNIVNFYPGRLSTGTSEDAGASRVHPALVHVDLYRITGEEEVLDLALHDLMNCDTVLAIEWPELYLKFVCEPYLIVELEHFDEMKRTVKLKPFGCRMKNILDSLTIRIDRDKNEGR